MSFRNRSSGFTLIELMVTLAVLGIVIGIAVPSFAELIRNNRAESQSSSVVNAFSVARSEAVKRGTTVTVAPLTAGTSWSGGWDVKAGTEVLRTFQALEGASLSGASGVQFNSRGQLVAGTAAATLEYRVGADSCRYERDIKVNMVGRVSVAKRACP
jgi:type IV fimbrial biogenesis protein FimT